MISLFPTRMIFVTIGSFSIHWYGMMYLLAFVVAYYLVQKLQQYRKISLSSDEWANILSAIIIGVLVGGRLGFVLFYEPLYFLKHPLEIAMVWKGGMSSHGGFLGVCIALLFLIPKYKVSLWAFADTIMVPVAIGLAFGRIGNFINIELYGVATTLPWGMHVPGSEDLHHPTQLYAVAKDVCIAAVCFMHLKKKPYVAGRTTGIFLLLYGVLRFLVEILRVQQYPNVDIAFISLTRGQILTIPLIIAGLTILYLKRSVESR